MTEVNTYDSEGDQANEESGQELAELLHALHEEDSIDPELLLPEEDEDYLIEEKKPDVYVVGHKSPDTDSITSAIAYANLKNITDKTRNYIPARAGAVQDETQYVLNHAEIEMPLFIDNVYTQVKDIDIRQFTGVHEDVTLRHAWSIMKERNIVTIPVTEPIEHSVKERFVGLATIKDIGSAYLDNTSSEILSNSGTLLSSVARVLEAEVAYDSGLKRFEKGKIFIGAGDANAIAGFIRKGDIVIVSNRRVTQKLSVQAGASCVILTMGAPATQELIDLAATKKCTILCTPHDTFSAAKIINQSIPISYIMKKNNIVGFTPEDYLEDVKDTMTKLKHRDFPVLDNDGSFIGMISRRFLLYARKKQVILVDHNEQGQAVAGIEGADILEIIDHHRLSSISTINPVFFRNQPVGSTNTIVFEMYNEQGITPSKQIATLMCAGILSDTLMFRSPTTTQVDRVAVLKLSEIAEINIEAFSKAMFHAGSQLDEKSPAELFSHDFKTFTVEGVDIGIGQINVMDQDELVSAREKLQTYLEEGMHEKQMDMVFFMLTDIPSSCTEVLYTGNGAASLLENAFERPIVDSSMKVEGLVSRKKQLVPELIVAMQK
ncbi:MAG: putative manganese-dependent inorganic diphosphatase [Clostridiales Family XIII bacterium]|jgi:manganese-dependent inorganic pyrophosphatase|nr:putative manganese-dependent inorganic diphosphatase [Clostridiales Family XIII bacterium]